MKYKVGDKVKYDGGDWWFYGTVSAVFEHPICPCYRLSVERMEKKTCKFSITQFEFELEAYNEVEQPVGDKFFQLKPEQFHVQEMVSVPEKKTRKKRKPKQEAEAEKVEETQKPAGTDAQKSKISDAWNKNLELYQKGEKSGSIYNWVSINRKLYKSGELPADKLEKLNAIDFPFVIDREKTEKVKLTKKPKKEAPKRKRGEAWDINYDMYRQGVKSNTISTWIALNRKEFKNGKLTEKKLDKLMEINFPFETTKKKKQVTGTND